MLIALDPGYGNTKIAVAADSAAVLQTAIARPVEIGDAASGLKVARRARRVVYAGREYVAGPGAWQWGQPYTNLDYAALASRERRALAFAALGDVLEPGEHTVSLMVIGLPVPLMQDSAMMKATLEGLKSYKGRQEFALDGRDYSLDIQRVQALAQPVGAYASWYYDAEGNVRKGAKKSQVAVLDIGMNTLDLYVIENWRVSPRYLGGAKIGVRRLLELSRNGHDLEELDAMLRSGSLRPSRGDMQSWLTEILGATGEAWPRLSRFDAVIPTGGGAAVLGESLRAALAARGAAVYWPDDPITANVLGLWRWGAQWLSRYAKTAL